jgi:hypothetical protein
MEVIIPESIEAIPILGGWSHQLALLRLVLRHEEGGTTTRCLPDSPSDGGKNVIGRLIIDGLCGIET